MNSNFLSVGYFKYQELAKQNGAAGTQVTGGAGSGGGKGGCQ